jgi:hypothetical protein
MKMFILGIKYMFHFNLKLLSEICFSADKYLGSCISDMTKNECSLLLIFANF